MGKNKVGELAGPSSRGKDAKSSRPAPEPSSSSDSEEPPQKKRAKAAPASSSSDTSSSSSSDDSSTSNSSSSSSSSDEEASAPAARPQPSPSSSSDTTSSPSSSSPSSTSSDDTSSSDKPTSSSSSDESSSDSESDKSDKEEEAGDAEEKEADGAALVAAADDKPRGPKFTEKKDTGPGRAAPVLPWMRLPVALESGSGVKLQDVRGLDPRLARSLKEDLGYEELFPVQCAVWRELAGGAATAHDLCVSAPTGSGKTLAYALPVCQALASSPGPSLRALVILPTRDLAAQVYSLFATLCPAVGLRVALAAGKDHLSQEAASLVRLDAGWSQQARPTSLVDVLVATPGRFVAHARATPGFSLSALRFLIVDETDRLLRQSYQDWLVQLEGMLPDPGAGRTSWTTPAASASGGAPRVVRLVLSATLTRDPTKIERLQLHWPRYISSSASDHRYHLPDTLKEWKLMCPASQKPTYLAALLRQLPPRGIIIFASSVDATHRLYLLLCGLLCQPPDAASGARSDKERQRADAKKNGKGKEAGEKGDAEAAAFSGTPWVFGHRVAEYSSRLGPQERTANLEAFRRGDATILVSSDAATRGIDVPGVDYIVNYDAPVYAKTYVHRAGRTARAGRSGEVCTLLRDAEVRHFKGMLRKADNNYVRDIKVEKQDVADASLRVESALRLMQRRLAQEAGAPVDQLRANIEEEDEELGAQAKHAAGPGATGLAGRPAIV